jgi:hypothetical protein
MEEMKILPDIEHRILHDFGRNRITDIQEKFEVFGRKFSGVYKEKPSPRIIRCIIHLASGNEAMLNQMIDAALQDWRDVIYWAEYNERDKRIFNGNKRFST